MDAELEILLRAEQEGIITPEDTRILAEARRRGMVPGASVSALGTAKAAGSGAIEGLMGTTVGLPGDLATLGNSGSRRPHPPIGLTTNILPEGFSGDPSKFPTPPTTQQISRALGTEYSPQNALERFTHSAAAGGAAGILPISPMGAGARVAMGAVGGIGGEAGANIAQRAGGGPLAEALSRIAGSVLATSPGIYAGMKKPQVVKGVQHFLEETPDSEFRAANLRRQVADETLGGPGTLVSQGILDPGNPIHGVTREVAMSPEGAPIRKILTNQLVEAEKKARGFVGSVAPARADMQTAANEVAATGKKALITKPQKMIRRLTRGLYEAADNDSLPAEEVRELAKALQGKLDELNLAAGTGAGKEVLSASRAVKGTVKKVPPTQKLVFDEATKNLDLVEVPGVPPAVPVKTLDSVTKDVGHKLNALATEAPTSANVRPGSQVGLTTAKTTIDEAARGKSPALDAAKKLTAKLHDKITRPLESSALKEVFPPSMLTKEPLTGDWEQFSKVFREPSRFGAEDIKYIADTLNKTDKKAFPAIVRYHLSKSFDTARKSEGGRVASNFLDDFPEMVAGSPGSALRENFREMMRGVAKANGSSPEEVARGAEKLMDAIQLAARNRDAQGAVNTATLRQEAGRNVASATLKSAGLNPGWYTGAALERVVQRRVYHKLAEMLTDPQKVDDLLWVARHSTTDTRTRMIVQSLLGVAGQEAAGAN